jgi:hypothetical protein
MEVLEIELQTDQAPLASGRQDPTQGELTEAQHLLDDADHRFDSTFACAIDRFAYRCPELVRHLDLSAGVFRRRIEQRRESLLPTGMMRTRCPRRDRYGPVDLIRMKTTCSNDGARVSGTLPSCTAKSVSAHIRVVRRWCGHTLPTCAPPPRMALGLALARYVQRRVLYVLYADS